MKVRVDIVLEFDDSTSKKDYQDAMSEIYEAIGNNVLDYYVIREEEV